jgi:hypothetical protein
MTRWAAPVRPEFTRLGDEPGEVTLYRATRRRADAAAVVVFPAPGEPRSGYSRTYRELARELAPAGVSTMVVDLDPIDDPDLVDRWRRRGDAARAFGAEQGHQVVLTVARGLSWAAIGDGAGEDVALVEPADGDEVPCPHFPDEKLCRWGFEEVWRGSPVPDQIARRIAESRSSRPEKATIIRHAGGSADQATASPRPPTSVTDPLFRRVWERSWLVATLAGLVHSG